MGELHEKKPSPILCNAKGGKARTSRETNELPLHCHPDSSIPQATNPLYEHLLDTYVSETNKVVSTWRNFSDADLEYKPHPKSTDVRGILKHQLLSERRFFGEFLVTPEPPPDEVLPATLTIETATTRFVELARKRLDFFAQQDTPWWMEIVPFFDVRRQRIWVFWRRVLHTAPPPHAAHRLPPPIGKRSPRRLRSNRRRYLAGRRPDPLRRSRRQKIAVKRLFC